MTEGGSAEHVDISDALKEIGDQEDEAVDIGEAALLLAALDQPDADLSFYRDHLSKIADDVAALVPGTSTHNVTKRTQALSDVMMGDRGYSGDHDTYDDPLNANLIKVIDRRKGLPVTLAIIYLDVARRLGWDATGINFPGHFMIRLERGTVRSIIDPFNGGIERDVADLRALLKQMAGLEAELQPDHYAPVTSRDTLIRLLNNIKLRALSGNDPERAAEIMDRMLLIAPSRLSLLQEAGIFYSRIGNLRRAATVLEEFLVQSTNETDRHEAATLLHKVRARLN
ncbi:MAG: tetratricopeptide repeat protein [Alphaproteobacteria bacterium]|nr:tetratricopeptide repeat protein [Alphaproteobacteria bacterium]